uniref:Uncharacterized protein n=1 Tax=Anguilla anguilla TaxID=7936 RepID=A0A0E9QVR0_ANGAN
MDSICIRTKAGFQESKNHHLPQSGTEARAQAPFPNSKNPTECLGFPEIS